MNWVFTDSNERFRVNLQNSALTWLPDQQDERPDATITLTRAVLDDILVRKTSFPDAIKTGAIKIDGDASKLIELLGLFDTFEPDFPIVTPRR